jgi:hypothetical protein
LRSGGGTPSGVSLVARDPGFAHCARVSATNLGYSGGGVCGIITLERRHHRGFRGWLRAAMGVPTAPPGHRDTSGSGGHLGRAHIAHPGRTEPRRTLRQQSVRPGQLLLSASCVLNEGCRPSNRGHMRPRQWYALASLRFPLGKMRSRCSIMRAGVRLNSARTSRIQSRSRCSCRG